MKKAADRVHMDATKTSGPFRSSLCGFTGPLSTTHDRSLATCKLCLARLRGEKPTKKAAIARFMDARAVASELHLELGLGAPQDLAPRAPAPPPLTPGIWQASCRTGSRCRDCELCTWQAQVEMWSFAAPWSYGHPEARKDGQGARWWSLSAALCSLVEYERSGRALRGTTGPILERQRLKLGRAQPPGVISVQGRHVDDIVHVAKALDRAYSTSHCRLPAEECSRMLLERTPGVLSAVTPWTTLAERVALPVEELQSIVRRGRRSMEDDLVGRGLVHRVGARSPRESAPNWEASDVF